MSTTELRRLVKKQVDTLQPERLQSAADYLSFLSKQRNGNKNETIDPRIARMRQRIREADEAEAAGKLIPLEKLRRKR
jgi:hypothetical protein